MERSWYLFSDFNSSQFWLTPAWQIKKPMSNSANIPDVHSWLGTISCSITVHRLGSLRREWTAIWTNKFFKFSPRFSSYKSPPCRWQVHVNSSKHPLQARSGDDVVNKATSLTTSVTSNLRLKSSGCPNFVSRCERTEKKRLSSICFMAL